MESNCLQENFVYLLQTRKMSNFHVKLCILLLTDNGRNTDMVSVEFQWLALQASKLISGSEIRILAVSFMKLFLNVVDFPVKPH